MRKHYYLICALFLSVELVAQPCTLTEADLLAAPVGTFTIPSGAILCINSNFCMGAASNFPGTCGNSNINSLNIQGTLRIAANVTFRFAGSINGTGSIEIHNLGRLRLFGSMNCAGGLDLYAVDGSISSGTSTVAVVSCSSPVCEPAFSNGYAPVGIITPGLGFTSTGCSITGFPIGRILPVDLTGFTGYANGNGVQLAWKTVSELNNRGFEVQRNKDAGNWEYAGWVGSKAVDGNSAITLDYHFTDNITGSFNSINYRLKQIDLNSQSTYSPVIRIEALKSDEWRVNVNGNTIYLQVQSTVSEIVLISVVGTAGNTLYKGKHSLNAGSNLIEIPAGNYANGLHVVSLQRSGGAIQREKILLQ